MKGSIQKIIGLTVSLICIILACTFTVKTKNITAGAGRGLDARITTIQEFSEMLQDFSAAEAVGTAFEGERNYSGYSVREFTSMRVRGDASMLFQRELEGFVSGEAAYYKTELALSLSVRIDGKSNHANLSMEMELYTAPNAVYLRLNRMIAGSGGESMSAPKSALGVWVDCSDEVLSSSAIGDISSYNFSVLSYLSEYVKGDAFEQTDDVYVLEQDAYQAFMNDFERGVLSEYGLKARKTGSLAIDLSDSAAPKLTLSDDGVWDELTFRNIDNTVIHLPDDLELISAEEFEEAMR